MKPMANVMSIKCRKEVIIIAKSQSTLNLLFRLISKDEQTLQQCERWCLVGEG